MSEEKRTGFPSPGVRIAAAFFAWILTGCLLAATLSLLGIHAMTSSGLHTRVALGKDSVDRQMERIEEKIQKMAEEYGFAPETVSALITRESVEAYDREIVAWWTGAASSGTLPEEPHYEPEGIGEALNADEEFLRGREEAMIRVNSDSVEREIAETVEKSAVLFRDLLIQAGFRFAGDSVDLPMMVSLLRKIPVIAGLAGLLMAGLIALVTSRRIRTAGRYIGGAMCACGLLMILVTILLKLLNLRGMIAEASAAMETQFIHLARILNLETLGCALVLMVLGGLLMLSARKDERKA